MVLSYSDRRIPTKSDFPETKDSTLEHVSTNSKFLPLIDHGSAFTLCTQIKTFEERCKQLHQSLTEALKFVSASEPRSADKPPATPAWFDRVVSLGTELGCESPPSGVLGPLWTICKATPWRKDDNVTREELQWLSENARAVGVSMEDECFQTAHHFCKTADQWFRFLRHNFKPDAPISAGAPKKDLLEMLEDVDTALSKWQGGEFEEEHPKNTIPSTIPPYCRERIDSAGESWRVPQETVNKLISHGEAFCRLCRSKLDDQTVPMGDFVAESVIELRGLQSAARSVLETLESNKQHSVGQ